MAIYPEKPMRTLFLLIFFIFGLTANATNYYVSASGNDSNNGTSTSTPWKTIAKINSRTFLPGDYILFRRGDMWREELTPPSSGVAGNPITFGAYGSGAKPIINGADIITGWASAGSNLWTHSQNTIVPNAIGALMVIINGQIQYPAASAGFCNFNTTTHIVTIYSTVDPNTIPVEVSQRPH
jgi:hypothetical protein